MPYRATADPILEQRERLNRIMSHPHETFPTDNPSALRYRIHEALHAARVLGIEPYCTLRVTVRTVRDAVVVTWNVPFKQQDAASTYVTFDPAIIEFPGSNEFEVIQSILEHPEVRCFEFTNFTGDVESVQAWVEARADLHVMDTEPLTIVRR